MIINIRNITEGSFIPIEEPHREHLIYNEKSNETRPLDTQYKYIITTPYTVDFTINDTEDVQRIEVPTDFLTDGNSGWFDRGVAWIFHDWLYATHEMVPGVAAEKAFADELLLAIQTARGQFPLVVWMHKVALGFPVVSEQSWESSGERGPEFYRLNQ
eukprot:TRINITY_DN9478_c0_g1_i1.p1 TRINITY_DN9478_c0_g1~~TRINITY_DN9478_c0_g1_i1.p1  ORF type:complete len:158 (-),score=25.50 TRINITY_DN9478_c0_g1_i1:75-548(-)